MAEDSEDSLPKSVVNAVKGRLSHPVGGIFITAWLVINWKMIFFLVVAGSPAEARINTALGYTNSWLGLRWPLIFTFSYLALSPWAKVGVARWNGWVAKNQALREYEDELRRLRQKRELEQRELQSMQPLVMSQQEAVVQLETQIKQLGERRIAAEHALKELMAMQSADWTALKAKIGFNEVNNVNRSVATQMLDDVSARFEKVLGFKSEMKEAFPKYQWDKLEKNP